MAAISCKLTRDMDSRGFHHKDQDLSSCRVETKAISHGYGHMTDMAGLDAHTAAGHELLAERDAYEAHRAFDRWVSSVRRWLNEVCPDSGLVSQWLSLPPSYLVKDDCYYDEPLAWANFRSAVHHRLTWLGQLTVRVADHRRTYVSRDRITELKEIQNPKFGLTRLVKMCEELNLCFEKECFLAVAMLIRAILDHVPPILGCKNFAQVASNYGGGSKSFKESMQNLENSSRKIADHYLHCMVRSKESLPHAQQVDFRPALDLLLAEVARSLRNT